MTVAQRLALAYIRTKFKFLSLLSKKKAARAAFQLFCTPQKRLRKPLPPVFEKADSIRLSFAGYSVQGWQWNAGSPRKVLIIHGFESSVTNFDRYVQPLINKGYEVLAFDAPAHGRSSGATITAPIYRDLIREIHKQYGPVESYMAHSFGGLAVSLALEEISHTDAYRLVLVAPATETESAIDSFFRILKLDSAVRREFETVIVQAGGVSSQWYSIKRAMRHIRASVCWFHDEDDDVTPVADVKAVEQENYPNIKFVYTSGLGHSRIYRDNKVTKAILEFL